MAIESPAHVKLDFFIAGLVAVLTSENSTDTFSDKIWSLKNKEWYVDGKAPLNLGYDAIRLRVDLVIPRVSAFGDIALTQV